MTQIRIGIVGYGNLGQGVEAALTHAPDMCLHAIYSRRPPEQVTALFPTSRVLPMEALQPDVDVLILCGGSKSDLPQQSPELARRFNIVDSFDTHASIPEHFAAVDAAAKEGGTTALISAGWDPGLFSIQRIMGEALLPQGDTYTFWGKGISQGHSDALRRIEGVADGVQYTIPSEEAIEAVRSGARPQLSTRQKHQRQCYVVLKDGANEDQVRQAIVTMPHYFAEYDTSVNFITHAELEREHSAMPHGGFVIRSGISGAENKTAQQVLEYRIALGSNPQFTASVLVAYARAVYRMAQMGMRGAKTVFDVAPGWVSPKSGAQLRQEAL